MLPKVRRQLKHYGGMAGEKEVWMHMAPSADDIKCRSGRECPEELREDAEGIQKSGENPVQDGQPSKGFKIGLFRAAYPSNSSLLVASAF